MPTKTNLSGSKNKNRVFVPIQKNEPARTSIREKYLTKYLLSNRLSKKKNKYRFKKFAASKRIISITIRINCYKGKGQILFWIFC